MRRRTEGVLDIEAFTRKLARAERHDAEKVIRTLEPFVTDERKRRLWTTADLRLGSVQVVFDAPHDPHNGAAVVRSCEAFGVQRVHVVETREPFLIAPSVAKSSEKWVDMSPHKTAESAVAALRNDGLELVATRADGELLPPDLARIPKLGLVLGNERDGIGAELMAACTRSVRVPMRGLVESLNVSVTAAILLASATAGRPGDLPWADKRRLYARGLYFTVAHAEELLE